MASGERARHVRVFLKDGSFWDLVEADDADFVDHLPREIARDRWRSR